MAKKKTNASEHPAGFDPADPESIRKRKFKRNEPLSFDPELFDPAYIPQKKLKLHAPADQRPREKKKQIVIAPDEIKFIEFIEDTPVLRSEQAAKFLENTRALLDISKNDLSKFLRVSAGSVSYWEANAYNVPQNIIDICATMRTLYTYASQFVEPYILKRLIFEVGGVYVLAVICCSHSMGKEAFANTLAYFVSPSLRKEMDLVRQRVEIHEERRREKEEAEREKIEALNAYKAIMKDKTKTRGYFLSCIKTLQRIRAKPERVLKLRYAIDQKSMLSKLNVLEKAVAKEKARLTESIRLREEEKKKEEEDDDEIEDV